MSSGERRSWYLQITAIICCWPYLSVVIPQDTHAAPTPIEKTVIIRWYGQSFFQVETPNGKKIVFDPHAIPEFGRPVVTADIILCSHRHTDHAMVEAIEGYQSARVFQGLKDAKGSRSPDWNLINEKVGTVRVRNVPTYHDAEDGRLRGKNAVWIIEIDGLTICHLGDLGHPLTPAQIKAIGPVDVLFIPIGGVYTLNGSAAKQVVDQLKPKRYVFPMHYGVPGYDELLPADEFLDGQSHVQRLMNTNEFHIPLESTSDKPMTIVLLGWQKAQAVKP